MVKLLAFAAIAAAGCGEMGETCGRGRCAADASCMSIFGPGRQNEGRQELAYPNVDNEWWCVRDCPEDMACAGRCMQNPADERVLVCAVDEVNVVYRSEGSACVCSAQNGAVACFADQPVDTVEILADCQSTAPVLTRCGPGEDCALPTTLHAGDRVPGVRLSTSGNGNQYSYCPARPQNQLAALLPEGETVRIYVDQSCP